MWNIVNARSLIIALEDDLVALSKFGKGWGRLEELACFCFYALIDCTLIRNKCFFASLLESTSERGCPHSDDHSHSHNFTSVPWSSLRAESRPDPVIPRSSSPNSLTLRSWVESFRRLIAPWLFPAQTLVPVENRKIHIFTTDEIPSKKMSVRSSVRTRRLSFLIFSHKN